MVGRVPLIEVVLPPDGLVPAAVTWNGELVEPDEVTLDDDGAVQVVIAGVTYNQENAEIVVRRSPA
jgi:hypothetical protein